MQLPAHRSRDGLPEGLVGRIGGTPLLRLSRVRPGGPPAVSVYGKAEWLNPGGSVKDRPALRMIEDAEAAGALRPGKTILDASSGNTGIAYAMIGAALGYPVELVVPANVNERKKGILAAYGADVVYTDPANGMDGAIETAVERHRRSPDRYFYADQYNNASNWRSHYDGTAMEIWSQTHGRVTHFVGGLGTSGTFTGVTRRLKTLNPKVRCVSVEPEGPFHGLEGLKHMETSKTPGIYDCGLADERLFIPTEEAYRMVVHMAKAEGLLVGLSAGAALAACVRVAGALGRDEEAHIVTVLPDSGERYLNERFWQDMV